MEKPLLVYVRWSLASVGIEFAKIEFETNQR